MAINNFTVQNLSSDTAPQSWQLLVGDVHVNVPALAKGTAQDCCSFDTDKISSLTVCVNGNVTQFTYSAPTPSDPAGQSGDQDKGGWAQSGANPYYSITANGTNITITCVI
ncbi:hypothetical protein [Polycladidibacter hongkongensis]|uniref:hypothetical protein n=1 Tax=Polycladidibacter hongkongensis TaxID=1647556 RepID=UPI00083385B6|nr:hypothetical protein [Pseudovibrio hongkongensis]